jgi:hypothetical protein
MPWPVPTRSVGLAGVGVSLVLLIGGIMAIGRPILGSGGS